jgi:hypothetical protein
MSNPLRAARLAPFSLALVFALSSAALAQNLNLPRPSPNASVSQTVGVTDITIHYSRPAVRGRAIWGALVPYDQVWRTGANENTQITFSTAVKIDGHDVPAGVYGLHTLPTASDWTIILNKDSDRWGSYTYEQAHDLLRFTVKPQAVANEERLSFGFEDVSDNAATVVLRWEKLRVPFKVEVDTPKLVSDQAKAAVRWQTPYQAANYCLQSNSCLDDAGRWLDASIALQENYANLRAKAQLQAKKNDFKGAAATGEKALAAGKSAQQPPAPEAVKELEGWVADWKKKG